MTGQIQTDTHGLLKLYRILPLIIDGEISRNQIMGGIHGIVKRQITPIHFIQHTDLQCFCILCCPCERNARYLLSALYDLIVTVCKEGTAISVLPLYLQRRATVVTTSVKGTFQWRII